MKSYREWKADGDDQLNELTALSGGANAIGAGLRQQASQVGTRNARAMAAVQNAMFQLANSDPASLRRAINVLRQSREIDPQTKMALTRAIGAITSMAGFGEE